MFLILYIITVSISAQVQLDKLRKHFHLAFSVLCCLAMTAAPPRFGRKVNLEELTVKFLTRKFGNSPDSLRSGCPEHYCNECGLGGQTFWPHPTPNNNFQDFSYQLKVKLEQPPLMCSDCAVMWFEVQDEQTNKGQNDNAQELVVSNEHIDLIIKCLKSFICDENSNIFYVTTRDRPDVKCGADKLVMMINPAMVSLMTNWFHDYIITLEKHCYRAKFMIKTNILFVIYLIAGETTDDTEKSIRELLPHQLLECCVSFIPHNSTTHNPATVWVGCSFTSDAMCRPLFLPIG